MYADEACLVPGICIYIYIGQQRWMKQTGLVVSLSSSSSGGTGEMPDYLTHTYVVQQQLVTDCRQTNFIKVTFGIYTCFLSVHETTAALRLVVVFIMY